MRVEYTHVWDGDAVITEKIVFYDPYSEMD